MAVQYTRFVSDLVGNPEDRFSHNEAQIKVPNFLTPNKLALINLNFIQIGYRVICLEDANELAHS